MNCNVKRKKETTTATSYRNSESQRKREPRVCVCVCIADRLLGNSIRKHKANANGCAALAHLVPSIITAVIHPLVWFLVTIDYYANSLVRFGLCVRS